MNSKSQYYLSQCLAAAAKSDMCFKLGAALVKGGKVLATGFNHQRPHYDGPDNRGHNGPVSMHAEQHAIFSLTGVTPSRKAQAADRPSWVQLGKQDTGAAKT